MPLRASRLGAPFASLTGVDITGRGMFEKEPPVPSGGSRLVWDPVYMVFERESNLTGSKLVRLQDATYGAVLCSVHMQGEMHLTSQGSILNKSGRNLQPADAAAITVLAPYRFRGRPPKITR